MKPIQILLAEDDADDRDIFHTFLSGRTDIAVMPIVENGEELLAYLDSISHPSHLPDIIILDHNMPRLSGRQTLDQLKGRQRYAHIPVLVYTTYADSQLVESCLRSGASMVVSKPLTQEGYHELVDSFMNVLV
jgi:CheY-like chemotaxis protein